MALTSSPEQPQPLGRIVLAVRDWVGRLGEVWVDAQVVEIKRRSAPTQFLTFRDRLTESSVQVTTTAYVLDAAGPLPEGSQVVARVRPRVWERSGQLSFECLELRVAGEGRLLAQLEQLKRKLQAEGLFDPHRKRRLPLLPRVIGLVTGKDSDAERDVLTTVARRWPAARFRIRHAVVQGPHAAAAVIGALSDLDEDPDVDVIIVARGGGSLEDLLPFSDEGVVRAVAETLTPVISAIGHERDVPLIDFVADVRASTPTDAGKRVVPDVAEELAIVRQARDRLARAVSSQLDTAQRRLDELRSRPVMVDPTSVFLPHFDRLELLRHRLGSAIDRRLHDEQATLRAHIGAIRAMSPKATLERGYAVLVDERQRSLSSVADTRPGAHIRAYLADGELALDVVEADRKDHHG